MVVVQAYIVACERDEYLLSEKELGAIYPAMLCFVARQRQTECPERQYGASVLDMSVFCWGQHTKGAMAKRWGTQHDDFDENIAAMHRPWWCGRGVCLDNSTANQISECEKSKCEPYSDLSDNE